jgi:hypothetical protein
MASAGAVRPDGKVLIDTGVIYFSPPAVGVLLSLARTHPLDSCTYQGLDCGRPALRIELYSDIMMAQTPLEDDSLPEESRLALTALPAGTQGCHGDAGRAGFG